MSDTQTFDPRRVLFEMLFSEGIAAIREDAKQMIREEQDANGFDGVLDLVADLAVELTYQMHLVEGAEQALALVREKGSVEAATAEVKARIVARGGFAPDEPAPVPTTTVEAPGFYL